MIPGCAPLGERTLTNYIPLAGGGQKDCGKAMRYAARGFANRGLRFFFRRRPGRLQFFLQTLRAKAGLGVLRHGAMRQFRAPAIPFRLAGHRGVATRAAGFHACDYLSNVRARQFRVCGQQRSHAEIEHSKLPGSVCESLFERSGLRLTARASLTNKASTARG
jgi:hypothetical protein